jgi:hypothetical protein
MVFQVEITQLVDDGGNIDPKFPARDFFKMFRTVIVRNIDSRSERTIRGTDNGKALAVQIDYGPKCGAGEFNRVKQLLGAGGVKLPAKRRKAVHA